jgi:hypothetical protein
VIELNNKELISTNGGGSIWKWIGRVMAALDNHVQEQGKYYRAEYEAGRYVPD